MKRASIGLIAACITVTSMVANAQKPAFDRFTAELAQTLESDAASVLTRGLFVDFAKQVCSRLTGTGAFEIERESSAWAVRNERFVRASTAALNEIGSRLLAEGGDQMRQGYFHMLRDASAKQVVVGIRRVFNGAALDNSLVPLPEQCLTEANRLASGSVDIQNSPNLTRALLPFMERRDLGRK